MYDQPDWNLYVTREEAAVIAGVTIDLIKVWIQEGHIHPLVYKDGPGTKPKFAIRISELEALTAARLQSISDRKRR